MINDRTFMSRVLGREGLSEIIQRNRRLPCNTCDNSRAKTYLRDFDEYLDDVEDFVSRYHGRSGFEEVRGGSGIKSNNIYTVEGAAFMLRVLNGDANLTIDINGFETRYNQNDEDNSSNREADIDKRSSTLVTGDILIECKSWAANGKGFQKMIEGEGSFGQFISYLSSIPAMNNLEYWFDEYKINETQAKNNFKTMMYNGTALTPQGNDVFDAIWANNLGLRESLFPRPAGVTDDDVYKDLSIQRFRTLVSTLDDTFFGFIKTK